MNNAALRRKKRRRAHKLFSVALLILIPIICFAVGKAGTGGQRGGASANPRQPSAPPANGPDAASPGSFADDRGPFVNGGPEDWMVFLVNAENPLPDGYRPVLKSLPNGLQFDGRAIGPLNEMLSEMRGQGLSPIVCSAYRTIGYQSALFHAKASSLEASGLSSREADREARKTVAYPGTSEHNLGLAADIVSSGYQTLDEKQADTREGRWLREHCAEYGFILRYPKEKEDITGVQYEPWHFRYVGAEAARDITGLGLCLEEYLKMQ